MEDGVYSAGLLACERLGAWELGADLLNELEQYGLPLVADHFDAALRACDKKERWQEVGDATGEPRRDSHSHSHSHS